MQPKAKLTLQTLIACVLFQGVVLAAFFWMGRDLLQSLLAHLQPFLGSQGGGCGAGIGRGLDPHGRADPAGDAISSRRDLRVGRRRHPVSLDRRSGHGAARRGFGGRGLPHGRPGEGFGAKTRTQGHRSAPGRYGPQGRRSGPDAFRAPAPRAVHRFSRRGPQPLRRRPDRRRGAQHP